MCKFEDTRRWAYFGHFSTWSFAICLDLKCGIHHEINMGITLQWRH